jgi:membrane protein DedA with SNARE-associated domain
VTHFVENYGLWVVFVVVLLEVAGLPFIPGETALIAAAVLASQGHGSIVWTIALAIVAAILGAGVSYAAGTGAAAC